MLENKTYFKRINRFNNSRLIEEGYNSIDMKTNLKSIKIETECFTNFVASNGAERYKIIKSLYYSLYKNREDIIKKYFTVDEIFYDSSIIRLQRIIYENTGITISLQNIVNKVQKFSYTNKKSIRLYFVKDDKKNLNLILVDLYHLALISKNRKYLLDYESHKFDKYDLKTICDNN